VRIAVTGASGFIGSVLCKQLASSGSEVIALSRRFARSLEHRGISHRSCGDLREEDRERIAALEGADAVVHLAALAHEKAQILEKQKDYETLRRVNAQGTERLACECAQAGIQHFVFLSTIGVCGDETFGRPFNEDSPAAPQSLYAASKYEAEQLLAEVSQRTGLRVTILRPTLVYGPGNGGNFLRLLRLVHRGWPMPFASVDNRRNLTYVGNLVSAVSTVLDRAGAGDVFVVCDSQALSTPQLVACLASGMRCNLRQFPVPGGLLRLVARAAGRSDTARRLLGSLEADNAKLSRLTSWLQPFEAQTALRETAEWFCAEGGRARSG